MIKLLILILMSSAAHARTLSWSINNTPSLMLTDRAGVINSNNAVMADSSSPLNQIRIEDIALPQEYCFTEMFTGFEKKRYTSFVRVKILDSFTEQELASFDMPEQAIIKLSDIPSSRIYMLVELHGDDIELRTAGVTMEKFDILNGITLNKDTIIASKDNLLISFTLNESAKLDLILYNRHGDICESFLAGKILDKGTYRFSMNPDKLSFDYLGDKRYYVWLRAENLRSKPVELIKPILIIPD